MSCLLGNTDRWVATGEAPPPPENRRSDESLRGSLWVAQVCGWTAAQLSACGRLSWLAGLPVELRLTLPGGRRLLAVHGSPASDEEGMGEHLPPAQLAELVRDAQADLIFAGHTHRAFHASIGGTEVHTVASVSNPKGSDTSAAYLLVDATERGQTVSLRFAPCDCTGVVSRAHAVGHRQRASWPGALVRNDLGTLPRRAVSQFGLY